MKASQFIGWLLLLTLLLCFGGRRSVAQEPADSLAAERWQELREELVYEKKTDRPELRTRSFTPFKTPDWVTRVLYVLFFVAAGLLIYFIVTRALAQPDAKLDEKIEAQLNAEDIREVKLEKLLAEALQDKNYRLAVRVYYLIVLQKLAEQELIRWKKDYTNRQYLRAMRRHPHYDDFAACTLSFEQIWYGNHPPTQARFEQLRAQFDALLEAVESKRPTSSQNPEANDL